jgi:hypothetical protein
MPLAPVSWTEVRRRSISSFGRYIGCRVDVFLQLIRHWRRPFFEILRSIPRELPERSQLKPKLSKMYAVLYSKLVPRFLGVVMDFPKGFINVCF